MTAAEDLAEWRASQSDSGRHVCALEEIAWLCQHLDAMAVEHPVLAVRNFSKGVRTLAGTLHALHTNKTLKQSDIDVAHEADSCAACRGAAQLVMQRCIEVTDYGQGRERFVEKRLLPYGWRRKNPLREKTEVWDYRSSLRVIWSEGKQLDGRWWAHVSVSRRDEKLPTWEQLTTVKDLFIGTEAEAYQVLPPEARYVNQHPGVLHLWACRDEPGGVLPDFTMGSGSI
jgi:hypothetical protein